MKSEYGLREKTESEEDSQHDSTVSQHSISTHNEELSSTLSASKSRRGDQSLGKADGKRLEARSGDPKPYWRVAGRRPKRGLDAV